MVRYRQKYGASLDKNLLGISRLLTARVAPEPARVDQGDLCHGEHPREYLWCGNALARKSWIAPQWYRSTVHAGGLF